MAKILMTGMAARGIGSERVRHDIVSLPAIIGSGLRELGHDVAGPMRTPLGTSLDGVDELWVQLGWVSSLSSTYVVECGQLMADAADRGVPIVRYVDDWRSQWLADDVSNHVRSDGGWNRHTRLWTVRAPEYSRLSHHDIDRARRAWTAVIDTNCPLLVPLMRWGDPALFDVSTRARLSATIIPWDPQPLQPYIVSDWAPPYQRARRWVVASLQDHDKWVGRQELSWPVLRLGGTKKGVGGIQLKGGGGAVISEREVIHRYAESWGVLSPEYLSAGSGYWRTRYMQAMGAGAIIWPGRKDADAIGGPFADTTVEAVEGMTVAELDDLAGAQAARLDSFLLSGEDTLRGLEAVVRGALR